MSLIYRKFPFFILFLSLPLLAVLLGTDTSVAVNHPGTLHYHETKFLPGTPPLKKGYEQTEAGIRPVVEKHEPRTVHFSRDALR